LREKYSPLLMVNISEDKETGVQIKKLEEIESSKNCYECRSCIIPLSPPSNMGGDEVQPLGFAQREEHSVDLSPEL
jgi:hypothetical protein